MKIGQLSVFQEGEGSRANAPKLEFNTKTHTHKLWGTP